MLQRGEGEAEGLCTRIRVGAGRGGGQSGEEGNDVPRERFGEEHEASGQAEPQVRAPATQRRAREAWPTASAVGIAEGEADEHHLPWNSDRTAIRWQSDGNQMAIRRRSGGDQMARFECRRGRRTP